MAGGSEQGTDRFQSTPLREGRHSAERIVTDNSVSIHAPA